MAPTSLVIVDILFSLFFVGPFTVLYWRGTFVGLYNLFLADVKLSNTWIPALFLYGVGLSMKILIDLTKEFLRDSITVRGWWIQTIVKLVIIYLDALFGVWLWLGCFNILYFLFPGMLWYQLFSVLLMSSLLMISLQAFKCTAGTPLTIITDTINNVFSPSRYFRDTDDAPGVLKIILDTLYTHAVVHTLVIWCWWSMWELENKYILLPCEIVIKDSKAWDSVLIAFVLSIIVFSINKMVKNHIRNKSSCSFVISILVSFAAFLASLNFWRGLWSVYDFYFFPNISQDINYLISHVVGFIWSVIAGTGLTLTMSAGKDSSTPEYNHCQYWSKDILEDENDDENLTETTPILGRNL